MVGHNNLSTVANPVERLADTQQIVIYPRPALPLATKRLTVMGEVQIEIARIDNPGKRSRPMSVSVKPPKPLEEHVGRTRIGYQEIGIDVERLLSRLGRDRDNPSPVPFRPKDAEKLAIKPGTIFEGKAAVVEERIRFGGDSTIIIYRVSNRAADQKDGLAIACSFYGFL